MKHDMAQLPSVLLQIVKVLHGADKDIQWLQRDFGLYVANMFDTGQASRALEYPGHGLAYLLQHLCQVKVRQQCKPVF